MDNHPDQQPTHSGRGLWSTHAQTQLSEVTSASVFASSASQVAYTTQSFVGAFSHSQFVDSQFQPTTTTYRIGGQNYQIATGAAEVYQPPHSTYERISPVEEYAEASTTTDGLQQFHNLPADGNQVLGVAVDTRALQRPDMGYPMQVLLERQQTGSPAVTRGISPIDRVSTHSPLAISQSQDVHNQHLMDVVQSSHTYSPIPSPAPGPGLSLISSTPGMSTLHYPSQSDGPTSSDAVSLIQPEPTDQETDQAVSSISLALQESVAQTTAKRSLRRVESFSNEPDTTQTDSSHAYDSTHDDSRDYVPHTGDDNSIDTSTLDSAINSTTMHTPSVHHVVQDHDLVSSQGSSLDAGLGSSTVADSQGHGCDMSPSLVLVDDQPSEDVVMHSLDLDTLRREPPVRKSMRISHTMGYENKPRPKYIPAPYNTEELWCEECLTAYAGECSHHKLTLVYDKVVLSRAWASLPGMLQIFRLGDTTELGVFARKQIPPLTQFGPFVAEVVKDRMALTSSKFVLQIDNYKNMGETVFLEATDENKCNWMMFVRPAENYAEQNLVVYQHQTDIYFTVTKPIEAKQELKVWYAAHYARNSGMRVLYPTEEDIQEMDERENKWPCFECHRKFRTSAALQNHLAQHENDPGTGDGDEQEYSGSETTKGKKKSFNLRSNLIRKRGRASKARHDALYNWKKKKTNMYLSKLKRQNLEANKPTRSLYKKREEGEGGGHEWVCTHCDLTFDNSSLLNLHTLTHAAEDVGLEEIKKLAGVDVFPGDLTSAIDSASSDSALQFPLQQEVDDVGIIALEEETNLECPLCKTAFVTKRDLIEHASTHGKAKRRDSTSSKPFKCESCWKSFNTQERLTKHMLCHGDESSKPLECGFCHKRFMNNSALSCHLKTHSEKKYFECPICREGFDQIAELKEHTLTHAENGMYTCPDCQKVFDDYHVIRKHIRAFHSDKRYQCSQCSKVFPRPDKLKLHMLRHSNHREFMCESCGRQFKRKDKLKEHMKRMHTPEREAMMMMRPSRPSGNKRFVPKVSPLDYHRFIYKCHMCLLGFKRRGMLVNHLAKRHPDIKPEAVPELNLPILKTQRDYYCQYCDKVYKSSSKRKAHILKNHPGNELPLSSRKRGAIPDMPGLPNPTYSQTVGSVTTIPHSCEFCHKQYASKAKLLQHQRKKHSGLVPPAQCKRRAGLDQVSVPVLEVKLDKEQFDDAGQVDSLQAADLLTQAMSELTQSLTDFRPQQLADVQLTPRIGIAPAGSPAMIQATAQTAGSTIELSHLGQALVQAHYQVAAPQQPQQQPQQQQLQQIAAVASSETVTIATSVPTTNISTITIPVSAVNLHTLVPRAWTTSAQFPAFR